VKSVKPFFYLFVLLFLVLIGFRYWQLESRIVGYSVPFVGMVDKEPDIKDTTTQLKIGKILVTVPKYPEYRYGDILEIDGKIEKPAVLEGFDYANYLKTKGIYFTVYNPKIKIIDRGKGNLFYSQILVLKEKLRKSVNLSMPSPESAIMGATILGGEVGISKDLQGKLNVAGVRHVIAVSGMNIVIISNVLMFLFLGLRVGKKWAIILSLISIFLFITLCAYETSAVRAGIMGSLFLIAPLFGRRSCGARTIIIAALIMLAINPYLLFYDVGFQLSFLATLGMIYLSTSFMRWLKFIPNGILGLQEILSSTFSAYIFTFPILIYSFGQVSLFGILANVLILPIVSLIMILGLVSALAGIFTPLIGWFLAIAPYFLLHYMLWIVNLLSKPWMTLAFNKFHIFWFIAYYIIFFILANYLYKKERSVPYFLK
jgi:competence protein ComEC